MIARVQPLSVLLGFVLASVCLLLMSQAIPIGNLRIEYGPHPRDMVQISEGQPYTVPAGKILVVTALGWTTPSYYSAVLRVDGQDVTAVTIAFGTAAPPASVSEIRSTVPLADSLTVASGHLVVPVGGQPNDQTDARAWGYLANQ